MGLDDFFPEILNEDFQQKEKRSKRSEKCKSCESKQFQPKIVGWQETISFQVPKNI